MEKEIKQKIEDSIKIRCSVCLYYKSKGYLEKDCLKCRIDWYDNKLIEAYKEIEKIKKSNNDLRKTWEKLDIENDELLKQVEKEKKAAILEFGQRLYRRVVQQALYLPDEYNQLFKDDINNLLTQYGINEKV